MRGTSSSLIKYSLFAFNLVFVITSIGLIVIGLIIHEEYLTYQEFLQDRYFSWPLLLSLLGAIMLFVTFFGCCGAIQENYCMIMMFSIMMISTFILELMGGFSGYSQAASTKKVLASSLNETMLLYNKSSEITQVWDTLQTHLDCCGINRYSDWFQVYNDTNGSLPLSCCSTAVGDFPVEFCNPQTPSLHFNPCLNTLSHVISENSLMLSAIGLAIALVQVVGIIFACFLAKSIRHHYEQF